MAMNIGSGADLREANLHGAYLYKANLHGANLRWANLRWADLYKANLREANLYKANLRWADLYKANLREANLYKANMYKADLYKADLLGANLYGANLCEADLRGADLRGADLRRADLHEANLRRADLHGADLCDTCLDPDAVVPDAREALVAVGLVPDADEYVIGYRTERSQHVGDTEYSPGEYVAPFFSVCTKTACHPGLYFGPRDAIERDYPDKALVQVRVHVSDVVAAGDKFRCKKFTVVSRIDAGEEAVT